MNENERNRRRALQAIIALSLTGAGIQVEAEASPVAWVLRTGGKLVLHGVLATVQVGALLAAKISEMHEEWHATGTDPEGLLATDNWERHASYYLTLHIPPGRNAIDKTFRLNLINLQSGTSEYVASVWLYAPPSTVCTLYKFPVPPVEHQGLFQYEAVLLLPGGDVSIQSSNPVLIQ